MDERRGGRPTTTRTPEPTARREVTATKRDQTKRNLATAVALVFTLPDHQMTHLDVAYWGRVRQAEQGSSIVRKEPITDEISITDEKLMKPTKNWKPCFCKSDRYLNESEIRVDEKSQPLEDGERADYQRVEGRDSEREHLRFDSATGANQ